MGKCIYCLESNKNFTDEHVIQNSLGGRKVIKNLVCEDCNYLFSQTIDKKIAEEFNIFRIFFNTKTGDKKTPTKQYGLIDKNGQEVILEKDGKPTRPKPTIIKNEEGEIIKVGYRGYDEAKEHYEFFKKYFDKKWEENLVLVDEKKYVNGIKISIDFSDELLLRAIAKIGFNYTAYIIGDNIFESSFDKIRNYIRYDEKPEYNPVLIYPLDDFEENETLGLADNSVSIFKPSQYPFLLSIVKLFHHLRYIILLNEKTQNFKHNYSYVVDPINSKNSESKIFDNPKINLEELKEYYKNKEAIYDFLNDSLEKIKEKSEILKRRDIIINSIDKYLKEYINGEILENNSKNFELFKNVLSNELMYSLFRIERKRVKEIEQLLN